MENYNSFYKRYGVRSPQMLMSPIMEPIELFVFPQNSLHHFVLYDAVIDGPPSDEYLYKNITKKIFVEHLHELTDFQGNPKKITVPLTPYIRAFHAKNKRYRLITDIASVHDTSSLVVVNYALISRIYRYIRSLYIEYFKWWNIQKTMWDQVATIATTTTRNQFIFAELPSVLPSVSTLDTYSKGLNGGLIRKLPTHESLFILEIWKWLSEEHRSTSLFANLTNQELHKVNIIFNDSGHWLMVNLGYLDDWRYIEGVTNPDAKIKLHPSQLQRRFLRMLMTLTEFRNSPIETKVVSDENTTLATRTDSEETNATQSGTMDDSESNLKNNVGSDLLINTQEKNKLEVIDSDAVATTSTTIKDKIKVPDGDNTIFIEYKDSAVEDSRRAKAEAMLVSLEDDLNQLEIIEKRNEAEFGAGDGKFVTKVNTNKLINHSDFGHAQTPIETFVQKCDALADDGNIAASQYKKFIKLAEESSHIKAPGSDETLAQYVQIDPVLIKIDSKSSVEDISTVPDKSMLHSSLIDFDKRYIEKVLPRDTVSMVNNVQRAGLIVNSYDVETIEDHMGAYELHTVNISPIEGRTNNIRFKLPKVNSDGVFISNGVKYRLRKQRGDLPIRKIAPELVALTTYYGKSFVSRNLRKTNNFSSWLQSQVMAKGLDASDTSITNLAPANVFDNHFLCPRSYSALSMSFKSFTANGFNFVLDQRERHKLISEEKLKALEVGSRILIASNSKGDLLLLDENDVLYKIENDKETIAGSIEAFLSLGENVPTEFTEARVYGQDLPVGFVLAYLIGLNKLIEKLHISYRSVEAGKRLNMTTNEFALAFSDETLIFEKDNKVATLILSGLSIFDKITRTFPVHLFNKKGVYLNLLMSMKLGVRYLREIDLMDSLFIDPISLELLKQLREPTTYQGLLIRSTQLLVVDKHPDILDMNFMRIKGYERISGAVYAEIVQAIREQKTRDNKALSAVDLNPYAIWKRIAQDPAVSIVNDINPIENLKQIEAVTFSGVGGRNSRSMVKKTRAYHPNDMGVISESTVDSGDVGINTYLSADPQFNSVRGTSNRFKIGKTGVTSLLSTSALLAPGSDKDDPKRVNFVGIQNSHVVSCVGYRQASVRTGYEQIVAHRVSDTFAVSARKNGRVIDVNDRGIKVLYEDNTTEGFELGRKFGAAAGLIIPHMLISRLKKGDTFSKNDILLYNSGFFEQDMLNPKNVVLKSGILAKTVLLESGQTLEDASSISKKLSEKLTTGITKLKTVTVQFKQEIRKVAKVGDTLSPENILCLIEDSITSNSDLFNEESLNTLKLINSQAPTSKVQGTLERIEVLYNGDLEDMSDTLRELAMQSDRELVLNAKAQGKKVFTGRTIEPIRVDGKTVELDCAVIKFYITSNVGAGVGDKGVFCNQMKTVFSEVLPTTMRTESGQEIDAVFGSKSIADRIVLSPDLIGTTNVLLDVIGKNAVKIYRGKSLKTS